jgi:predicted nucleotidyltransferase
LGEILASGEGLEHKLKRALPKSSNMNELKSAVKSKRYTETRINRLMIQTIIGLHKKQFFKILDDDILYARVLALSKRGGEYLRYVKKNELNRIPILTHIRKEINEDNPIFELLSYDILASDIFNHLLFGEIYSHSDYVKRPFVKI